MFLLEHLQQPGEVHDPTPPTSAHTFEILRPSMEREVEQCSASSTNSSASMGPPKPGGTPPRSTSPPGATNSSPVRRTPRAEIGGAQLARFLDSEHPYRALVRGVTTNPSLVAASVLASPDHWESWLRRRVRSGKIADADHAFSAVYEEVLRRAADFTHRSGAPRSSRTAGSGSLHAGQEITVLPSGTTSAIESIDALGEPAGSARAPQSLTLRLADDLGASRGDLIVPSGCSVRPSREITATVCHLHERPLVPGQRVLLRHSTRTVSAVVRDVRFRLVPDTSRERPHRAP